MYSRHHLVASLATALAALPFLDTGGDWLWPLAWAAAVGTLIDLDHFLVARVRTGSWDALRRCLTRPRVALVDQDEIFPAGTVGAMERLLTHLLFGGGLVAGLAIRVPSVAVLTAAVLYVHLLADVAWELSSAGEAAAGAPR